MNDWRKISLSEVIRRATTKDLGGINENVLTVFAEHGLIGQGLYSTKAASNETSSGYCVVAPGQYVDNKSASNGFGIG